MDDLPSGGDDGCSEWHRCKWCEVMVDTAEETRVDHPYVVGTGWQGHGQCFRTLEAAEQSARTGLAGNTVTVWRAGKTEWVDSVGDVSHPTLIAVYRSGEKLDAHLTFALHALAEVARVGEAGLRGFDAPKALSEDYAGQYAARLVLRAIEELEAKLGTKAEATS